MENQANYCVMACEGGLPFIKQSNLTEEEAKKIAQAMRDEIPDRDRRWRWARAVPQKDAE